MREPEESAVALPSTVAPSECLYLASASLNFDLISDGSRLLGLLLIFKCDTEAIAAGYTMCLRCRKTSPSMIS